MNSRDMQRGIAPRAGVQGGLRRDERPRGSRAAAGHRGQSGLRAEVAGRIATRPGRWEVAALWRSRPASRLFGLLQLFKAARQRRDDASVGSAEWNAADADITDLQRQIFDLTLDDQSADPQNRPPRLI
jgi:hypothetical protein